MKSTARVNLAVALIGVLVVCCTTTGTLGPVPSAAATPAPSLETGEPDLTPAPSVTSTPSAAPSDAASTDPNAGPPAGPSGTTIVRTYFYLAEGTDADIAPFLREVPETKAVARAAMTALLGGPTAADRGYPSIGSAIPAGTRLLGLTIADRIATVDLSSEFESGSGSASVLTRLGQVVFTLTQFSTVKSVVFQIEGQTVTVFGSEGVVLDGPVGRARFQELLPDIYVDRPAYGAALGNPGRVTGSENVWEATFRITILDGGGRTIADKSAMGTCDSNCQAQCNNGCRGTFDVTLGYDVPKAQWGTLRVWAGSAKDGSPVSVREYPVWLTPAR